ncbi:MAG: DNA-processing protein DprA [Oscillibacter ruminantium]|uniref:DNA-processing protein DprA n=1 Tax=Oscillibacter ruminantium TaxID=1263547 RepID=UPI002B204CB2|nr:DNA-processing protein DprA [Oscillibacter ruminantium]MEA5041056.1 DNA-processing protein DprA [Oscillibacter ruminantium]
MSMLKYWVWLSELAGLGNQTRLALLEHFNTPEDVYYADEGEILLTEGMTRREADALKAKDLTEAEKILADCERLELQVLTLRDAAYPVRLRSIYDPPCLLYLRGRLPEVDELPAVAVVGTRKASPYGIRCAEDLAFGLADAGALVVTGLARGIDSMAAQGALRAGGTVIGVLGGGVDVIYPKENGWLYDDVAAAGCLVSEYPPGTEPLPAHFPIRNRIMSGLSVAALVVEAPVRSGALITAGMALDQGRDVFAVPGPIYAENSKGCNRLIRDGAGVAAEPWDILRDYEAQFPGKLRGTTRSAPEPLETQPGQMVETAEPAMPSLSLKGAGLTDDQILLLRTLTDQPMLTDDLIELTELPTRRVLSALTMLEIDQYVTQCSGKRYMRAVTLSE